MKEFFRNRFVEFSGIMFMMLAVFFAVSIATYSPYDPSLNLETNAVVSNIGGWIGAYIASPAIGFIGIASYIPSIIIFIWGVSLIRKDGVPKLWLKATMLLLLLPVSAGFFSIFDSLIDIPNSWAKDSSFGGFIGNYLNENISSVITVWGYAVAIIIFTVIIFYFSAGMAISNWKSVVKNFFLIIRTLFNTLLFLNNKIKCLFGKEEEIIEKTTRKRKITGKRKQKEQKGEQAEFDIDMRDTYQIPPVDLLKLPPSKRKNAFTESSLVQNAELLEKVLNDFGISGKITEVSPGPVVTLYSLEPSPGTKSSRVIGLADDIARSMSAISARIAVIPGKNAIGIELPNSSRETVFFRDLLESEGFKNTKYNLPLALGKDISGNEMIIDLAKTPHLLVAGTTGSGKSVGLNAMILSLLYKYSPDECKFIMIDPKMLELSVYADIPHLLTPVVTEPGKAVVALKWTVKEMENRYRLMSNLGVRNIYGYNEKIEKAVKKGETLTRSVQTGFDIETGKPTIETIPLDMESMPFIVVIVDEMADLMLVGGKDIEMSVQRLAQMARAAGIHVILATQRPSVDVITGIIKANFPTRISFQVTSKIDSRTILGEQGAEQLLGMGDMLYMAGGSRTVRIHGPFVDDNEVEKVAEFLKSQGEPSYVEEVTIDEGGEVGFTDSVEKDELFDSAVSIVQKEGKVSTSFVQRSLKIGYNRAANIIEQMEKDGIISPPSHSGKRELL